MYGPGSLRGGRCTAWMLAVLLGVGWAPAVGTAPAAAAPAAQTPVAGVDADQPAVTEVAASARARQTGQRVEVLSARAETREVYALPSGRFELVQHLRPVRARKDGRWVPVDTTLTRTPDGGLAPAAATVDLRLSGGGTAPFVTMSRVGRRLALSWPGRLPAPTVDGDTATYADVLPGVDLRVRARVDGFSHLLVVKTPQAARNPALASLRFKVDAPGLSMTTDPAGVMKVTDRRSGGEVFQAPAPLMWDSPPSPATSRAEPGGAGPGAAAATGPVGTARHGELDGPREGARTARLGVGLAAGELRLSPDRGMLTAPGTRFPVYLDPVWKTVQDSARIMVSSAYPTTSYWDFNGKSTEGLGLCDVQLDGDCGRDQRKRLFYRVPISSMAGKHIISAEFTAYETHAYNCSDNRTVQLWHAKPFLTTSTWNTTADNWLSQLASRDVSYCSRTPVEFGGSALRNVVQAAATRKDGTITFGLKAHSESSMAWWKRYADDAFLRIQYNTPPPQPPVKNLSMSPGGPCPVPSAPPTVNRLPTLYAILTDADSGDAAKLYAEYTIAWSGGSWVSPRIGPKTTGSTFQVTAPSTIPQNTALSWYVRTWDGYEYSPWSSSGAAERCHFRYDSAAPPAPTVSSTDYPASDPENPDDPWHDGVGRYGQFTISAAAADVNRYWIGVNTTPTQAGEYRPASPGGPVTVPIAPTRSGVNFLYVKALDAAGNASAPATYLFRVNAGSGPKAHWRLDEPAGSTTVTATTVDGVPAADATATGGATLGVDGQVGTALRGDGRTGYAQTAEPVIDTNASFAVAAWVKLENTNGFATAVSQDGSVVAGFYLQYAKANDRWAFALNNDDALAGGVRVLSTAPPAVGEWTHLVGVYDAVAHKARLYVNGALQQEQAFTVDWNATGPMAIGRAWHNSAKVDFFPGAIDDVRVFDRIVTAEEVADLFAAHPVVAGRWTLNTDGTDGSGRGRHLSLAGDARIDQAAGWLGSPPGALVLDGSGDYAATAGPVVATHRGFTVAGWATSAAAPTGRAAVFSQAGATNSGFTLRYDPAVAGGAGGWQVELPDADTAGAALQTADHSAYRWQLDWDHVAIVYDSFADVLRLYVNGSLEQTEARASERWNTLGFDATGPLQIGRSKSGGVWGEYWPGAIDDVWAFSGVLSQEQIQALAGYTELPSDSPF